MLETILSKCDKRNDQYGCEQCADCSYDAYCPHNCENWIIFTIHLMPLTEHRKENMTVRTWQMFIHANTLADMLLKLSMPLSGSKIYPI